MNALQLFALIVGVVYAISMALAILLQMHHRWYWWAFGVFAVVSSMYTILETKRL